MAYFLYMCFNNKSALFQITQYLAKYFLWYHNISFYKKYTKYIMFWFRIKLGRLLRSYNKISSNWLARQNIRSRHIIRNSFEKIIIIALFIFIPLNFTIFKFLVLSVVLFFKYLVLIKDIAIFAFLVEKKYNQIIS